jgi:hypothetical protein
MIEKKCTGCNEVKPLEAFSLHPSCRYGRNSRCRICKNEQAATYYLNNRPENPAKWEERGRAGWLKGAYGLSLDDFDGLMEAQGGVCAICGDPPGAKRFHVDHCHRTRLVRGLLCFCCNSGLGSFKDNEDRLFAAVDYLRRTMPSGEAQAA